jgi:hypothetical protein
MRAFAVKPEFLSAFAAAGSKFEIFVGFSAGRLFNG